VGYIEMAKFSHGIIMVWFLKGLKQFPKLSALCQKVAVSCEIWPILKEFIP
jgi:hypothetical protein